jgi:hypothetical protein
MSQNTICRLFEFSDLLENLSTQKFGNGEKRAFWFGFCLFKQATKVLHSGWQRTMQHCRHVRNAKENEKTKKD